MFLNQIISIFNKKSKAEQSKNKTEVRSPSPPIKEEEAAVNTISDETPPTSFVSNNTNSNRPTSMTTLPEVEFEESRNLMKLDFFSDSNEHIDNATTTFPNFDYLLQDKQVKAQDNDKSIKKRKLSTTIRHRITLYKPNKTVKRTLSTPHFTQ